MCKRMMAALLAFGMLFVNVPGVLAADLFTRAVPGGAVGTLDPIGMNTLTVTLVSNAPTAPNAGNGNLQFAPVAGIPGLLPQGDELVKIQFTANNDTLGTDFKSITILTDNKDVLSAFDPAPDPAASAQNFFPAGLVLDDPDPTIEGDVSVPLHWAVFPTSAEAIAYNILDYDHDNDQQNNFAGPRTQDEFIDSRVQLFVSDRSGSGNPTSDCDPALPGVQAYCQGFATVLIGLNGSTAALANAPKAASCTNADPRLCANNDADLPSDPPVVNRMITNGEAYVLVAANFATAPAGTYATNRLFIQMVNLAP